MSRAARAPRSRRVRAAAGAAAARAHVLACVFIQLRRCGRTDLPAAGWRAARQYALDHRFGHARFGRARHGRGMARRTHRRAGAARLGAARRRAARHARVRHELCVGLDEPGFAGLSRRVHRHHDGLLPARLSPRGRRAARSRPCARRVGARARLQPLGRFRARRAAAIAACAVRLDAPRRARRALGIRRVHAIAFSHAACDARASAMRSGAGAGRSRRASSPSTPPPWACRSR